MMCVYIVYMCVSICMCMYCVSSMYLCVYAVCMCICMYMSVYSVHMSV